MIKIEAVVIRERVETVIDAVEDATGHVGVTVIENWFSTRSRNWSAHFWIACWSEPALKRQST